MMSVGHGGMGAPTSMVGGSALGGIGAKDDNKPITTKSGSDHLYIEGKHYEKIGQKLKSLRKMIADELAKAQDDTVYWHGSPSGDLRGGKNGLHLGTKWAAQQALEARIGIPVEGSWDGTREYGKTLLSGQKRLKSGEKGQYRLSGYNSTAPEHDYYPHQHPEGFPKYSDNTSVAHDAKPEVAAYRLKGPMSNTRSNPHKDFKANAMMAAQITRGAAKRGYYYTNQGEDVGSTSIVVPHHSHVERIKPGSE